MKNTLKSLFTMALLTVSFSAVADEGEAPWLKEAQEGDVISQYLIVSAACDKGDYYSALDWQEKVANWSYGKDNKVWNQYKLAMMYNKGRCIDAEYEQCTPNYPKALEWYSRVAYSRSKNPEDMGHIYDAKFNIAGIYFWGKGGINKNEMLAKRLYEELANLPDDKLDDGGVISETRGNARYRLAQMHYYGVSATQDYSRAYQWAEKASQDKNPYGAMIAAVLLYNGLGVKQNKAEGLRVMGAVCDGFGEQKACDLHKKMKANQPIDF